MTQATEVLFPTSADEAAAAFGDGDGVTVIGGGTIVVPEITHGRLRRRRRSCSRAPGLSGITRDGDDASRSARRHRSQALRRALRPARAVRRERRRHRDPRRRARSAATSAPAPAPTRRAAISRARCSRSAQPSARPAPAASAASRSRSSSATATGGCCSTSRSTSPRRARSRRSTTRTRTSTRCSPCPAHGRRRHRPARRDRRGGTGARPLPRPAADPGRRRGCARDVALHDDALASAWYRRRRSPCSFAVSSPSSRRPHEPHRQRHRHATIESAPLTRLLDVLREELGITSPKAGCEQGGCGACTVLVDGEPRRSCLTPVGGDRRRRDHDRRGARDTGEPRTDPAGVHAPLRRAVRLLHLGDDDRSARVHRRAAAATTARRSRRRSAATSAAAPGTSRSSTRSRQLPAATRSISPSLPPAPSMTNLGGVQ